MKLLAPSESRTTLVGRVITDPTDLQALAPAWRELLGRSSVNSPMLSPQWMLSWWRVFGDLDGRRLAAAAVTVGDRLEGLAPLLRRRHWHRHCLPLRRLEPLSTGEAEADAVCPDYLHVIAARGQEAAVASALARLLAQGTLGAWDEMVWPRMDAAAPMTAHLGEALRHQGLVVTQTNAGASPCILLPPTWDAYVAALPSSHRYYLKRSLRDFQRWAGSSVQLRCAVTQAELREGLAILACLHGQRWQQAGEPGRFASARFRAFHEALMPALLNEGALELLTLYVRREPVAALYNIVWDGKVYFYQSGRKMDVPDSVRPGLVLHAHAIRRAIEAGRGEYDFLAGAVRYKEQLALASRPLVDLRVVRPSLREGARRLLEKGAAWVRAVRQRWRMSSGL